VSTLNAHLTDLVGSLSAELPEVTTRRMFGADTFFANRNIDCLVHRA
jgi:TfoX/Sxy family transcriptional regulator of competence genes